MNVCERGAAKQISQVVQVSRVRMNPYVRLLQGALLEAGVACEVLEGLSPRLLQPFLGISDVLHVHWLELLYASGSFGRSLRLFAAVFLGLLRAKAGGCRLVYTLHNLTPHERGIVIIDRLARLLLVRMVDAIHVHGDRAAADMAETFARHDRVYVIPHGSYIGAYPNQCEQGQARTRLGLPENAFVFLFLGQVRRYKGVEDLVTAFSRLGDETSWLLIGGNAHDAEYSDELTQLTKDKERVLARLQYVPDAEVQYFLNACDVCVMPYREATTSGAAILAFSFGKPIVAPSLGGFPDLAGDGRGILYEPEEGGGLVEAMRRARSEDMAAAGQKALAWAMEHEWRALAPAFVRMYTDVLQTG